jgi:uncharacterized coiled-coil protein SlyX
MDNQNEDLQKRVETLEAKFAVAEEKSQQLTQLLASLAQVTQQLLEANNVVLDVAKKIQNKP